MPMGQVHSTCQNHHLVVLAQPIVSNPRIESWLLHVSPVLRVANAQGRLPMTLGPDS